MPQRNFLYGAATLFAAGLVSRVLGAFHRIILPRVMGAETVGLLQMAYPVYNVFLVAAVAGIPVAVSKLIAERTAYNDAAGARKVFRVALAALCLTGMGCAVVLYLVAPSLARFFLGDPAAAMPLRAITASVAFLPAAAVLRGYFQGCQEMVPSAVGQVVEQAVRVTSMVGLAILCRPYGIEMAAAGAGAGAVVGNFVGLVVLALWYRSEANTAQRPRPNRLQGEKTTVRGILSRLWGLALPAALGAMVMPLANLLDAFIVPRGLQNLGYTLEMTRHFYGELTGMAMALVYFPTVLTLGLAGSLVPAVAEALAWRNKQLLYQRVEDSLRISMSWALPCALGMGFLATPICNLLFGEGGAGNILVFLAPAVIFICLQETAVAILQGLGRSTVVVWNMVYGALIKGIMTYTLVTVPALGPKGAAIGTVMGFACSSLLNLRAVERYSGYRTSWDMVFYRPLLAALLMMFTIKPWYTLGQSVGMIIGGEPSGPLGTIFAVAGAVPVYFTALMVLGGLPLGILEGLRRFMPKKFNLR